MARKCRIEFAGAQYHLINRGNYRAWIFETEGARRSFLRCLCEVCEAKGWELLAWCLMSNHYHLLVRTPEPNLVEGMRWLQSTFANRFNRFRKENGHVFQGRYKAILLEPAAVGAVSHYIHLNPVRAGRVQADALQTFEASSFHHLWYARKRWSFEDCRACLCAAGFQADTPATRKAYRAFLGRLSGDDTAQAQLGFEGMTQGWAIGSQEFKNEVFEQNLAKSPRAVVEAEARELKAMRWERQLRTHLNLLGKTQTQINTASKGADWKVAIARDLRERMLAPNSWLAERLQMGTPNSLSSRLSRHRREKQDSDPIWKKLKNQKNVD